MNLKIILFLIVVLMGSVVFLHSKNVAAQSACPTAPAPNKSISDNLVTAVGNITNLINSTGKCIQGQTVRVDLESAKIKGYSYGVLKTHFYTKSKLTAGTTPITLPNPLAWWKLDNNITDSSGNGFSGSTNGTYTNGQGGQALGALNLNGSSQYATVGAASVQNLSQFTISAWVYPKVLPASGSTEKIYEEVTGNDGTKTRVALSLSNNTNGANGLRFTLSFRTGLGSTTAQPTSTVTSSYVVQQNTWQHVVAVFNSDTDIFSTYINGSTTPDENFSVPGEFAMANSPPALASRIGARPQGPAGDYFNGYVDDVRVYNRALTTTEIAALYNSYLNLSAPKKFPPASPTSGNMTEAYFNSGAGAITSDGVYDIAGNLDINNTITATSSTPKTIVVFVEGDLTISTNTLVYGDDNSGIVFVVNGDINITPNVTEIDAVLISQGQICTAYEVGNGGCNAGKLNDTQALTIKGSLVTFDSTKPIRFRRNLNLTNNTSPSEIIIAQPKYLFILKGVMSEDLIIPVQQ